MLAAEEQSSSPAATSIPAEDQFYRTPTTEPHITRRKLSLAKSPQTTKSFGPDPSIKYKISIIFVLLSSKTLLTGNTKLSKKISIPDTKRRKEFNSICG